MKTFEALKKIEKYKDAIAYSREENREAHLKHKLAILTTGECICVHQAISALYKVVDGIHEKPVKTVSVQIANMIESINNGIILHSWERPQFKY